MDSIRIPKVLEVLGVLGLGVLGVGLAGCPDKQKSTGCGNGLLGVGEDCDCGTDPNNLEPGSYALLLKALPGVGPGVVMSGPFTGNLVIDP